MTILDEFELKTIEIRSIGANDTRPTITKHPAWCYGEIGVVATKLDDDPKWILVCIPIGAVFPVKRLGFYDTIEDACGAAKEMARANNSWASVVRFDKTLVATMLSIAAKYGAVTGVYMPPQGKIPAGDKLYLNGSTAEQINQ